MNVYGGNDGFRSANKVKAPLSPEIRFPKGPTFAETTELIGIGGFSNWKVSSLLEAIDWMKKRPNSMTEDYEIEIRPLMEPKDFAGLIARRRNVIHVAAGPAVE